MRYRKACVPGMVALLMTVCGGCPSSDSYLATLEELAPTSTAYPMKVTPERVARLARGVNITEWFNYPRPNPDTRLSRDDFELIRKLGFTYIRLPVYFEYIYDGNNADLMHFAHLREIDNAILRILEHGLAVSVDIHNITREAAGVSIYTVDMEKNPITARRFVNFWSKFAAHLSAFDPEGVFLELMNEPYYKDRYQDWYALQERTAAVRARAPRHTIIATSPYWSNWYTFIEMKPLPDPNIVYTFHFYEPVLFVNQGIDWGLPLFKDLRGVPYPINPQAVAAAIEKTSNPLAAGWLALYGAQRWDGERLMQIMGKVAAWGEKHGVPVICNEFGVYKRYSAPADRRRWFTDVRRAFDAHGIGWAVWTYDEPNTFGMAEHTGGTITIDADMTRGLNLNGYASRETPVNRPPPVVSPPPPPEGSETRTPGQRVKADGFSFPAIGGFEIHLGAGYAVLANAAESTMIILVKAKSVFGQTAEATLSHLLAVLKDMERPQNGPFREIMLNRDKGMAVDVKGRLSGTALAGEIAAIRHDDSFFIAFGFSADGDENGLWEKRGRKTFEDVLDSVVFY